MTTLATKFDEVNQSEAWQKNVAKELNILLGRAQHFTETSNDSSDKEACKATLSIVERVREFEKIQTVDEVKESQKQR